MKCKTCECESKYPYHEGCAKKANIRLEILSTGDWCATYNADTGECLHQGHTPNLWVIADAIGVEIIETPEADHHLESGQFPDKLPED